MPKYVKGGINWDFQHPLGRKTPKTLKGSLWETIVSRKSLTMPKKLKDRLVSPGIVSYARKKTFLVLFPGPTGTILQHLKILYNFW